MQELINPTRHPAQAGDRSCSFVVRRGGEDLTDPGHAAGEHRPEREARRRGRRAERASSRIPGSSASIVAGAAAGRRLRLGRRSRRSAACSRPRGSRTTSASSPATPAATPTSRSGSCRRSASAGVANDAVKAGWVSVFGLLIAINVFVGLFNLLPLLPFDGGHIAIALYETRRVDGPAPAGPGRRGQADADHGRGGGRARASSSCRACSSTSPTRSPTRSERVARGGRPRVR